MKSKLFGSATRKGLLAVGAAMLVWGAAAAIVLRCPVLDIAKFLGYQALFVALPGLGLFKLLKLSLTPLESLVTSYALGLALNIAVYFMFAPFGLIEWLPFGLLVLPVFGAFALFKTRKSHLAHVTDSGELKIAIIFCCIAAVLTFYMLSATHLNPDLSGARRYYHDNLNGVALLASASRGFPFEFLQMSGTPYYYHPFFYAYGACMEHVLNISAFELATKYMTITITPLFAAAFVASARRFIKRNYLIVIASVLVVVLPFHPTFTYYLYTDLLGFTMGLAMFMTTLNLFLKAQQMPSKKLNRYHVLTMVFLLLTLGSKGPIAVTLLFALCFVLLIELITKKNWNVLLKGLLLAVPFFVLYFALYRDGAADSMGFFSFGRMARLTPFSDWLVTQKLPNWLYLTLICIVYILTDFTLMVAVLALAMWYLCSKKNKNKFPGITFLVSGLWFGMFMMSSVSQAGSSQIYFLLCLLPLSYIGAGALAEWLYAKVKKDSAKKALRITGAAAALALAALGFFGGIERYVSSAEEAVRFSWMNPAGHITTEQQLQELHDDNTMRRHYITPQEYEAMLWIRDNTPKDAVFASARSFTNNKYFYGSALAERPFYLEGYGYVTMEDSNQYTEERFRRTRFMEVLYREESPDLAIYLAKEEGIDYFIVEEYTNPGYELPDYAATLVFENEHVRIYKALEF